MKQSSYSFLPVHSQRPTTLKTFFPQLPLSTSSFTFLFPLRRWFGAGPPHPSNCTRLWCSKYPQSTRKIFLGKLKVRRPGPHHGETDPLECLRQAQDQGHCSHIFLSRAIFEPLHFRQNSPNCRLSSSISAISRVPINPILLMPLRHFWCPQSTDVSNVGINAIGLSLVTFFGIKKNIFVEACCGLFPLCSTLSKKLHLFLLSSPTELWGGSHRILLLSSPCTLSTLFPVRTLFALVGLPRISSNPHFSEACVSSMFCTLSSHCQCSAHSFLFASQRSSNLTSSSFFFKICAPPLHEVGFVIFMQEPGTVFRTLGHLIHPSLMQFFQSFSSHPPVFICPTKQIIFEWFLPLLDEATLTRNPPPATQPPTIC